MQPMEPLPPNAVSFAGGEVRPALGLGTWRMGEQPGAAAAEVASLRLALELGYRVFDTAEMYGDGGAETLLGRALAEALRSDTRLAREDCFVVSKVLPQHANAAGVLAACERSLKRLQLDQLDLYLLHWRGSVPLGETLKGLQTLQRRGLIRHWGVSNFDTADLHELAALPGGADCATNQVYFSLSERGAQWDLLPWMRAHAMPLMAYCPLDQGVLVAHPALVPLAARHGCTPGEVALAWVLGQEGVMAIPKAGREAHLRSNWRAQQLVLDAQDWAALDAAFPPPRRKRPLAVS
jgi:diketogulonate reductase-like aldo/keto reductase